MSNKVAKINPQETAHKIVEALAGGLVKAAQIYREYVDAGGDVMKLRRAAPVSADLWRTLDDVSTGRIDVRVLCLPAKASRSIRLLPKTFQSEVIENGVELLVSGGTAIRIPVAELTPAQAEQVLCKDGIRSLSQQAAWVQSTKPSLDIRSNPVPYEVKGGKLRVYEPIELTASDIHRILALIG